MSLRKYLNFLQKKQSSGIKKPKLRLILGAQSSPSSTQESQTEQQQTIQLIQPKHWGNKHYYLIQVGDPQSGKYIAGFVHGLDHTRMAPSPQDVQLWLNSHSVATKPIKHTQFPHTKHAQDLLQSAVKQLESIRDPHAILTIDTKGDLVHPDFHYIEPHPDNPYKNRKFIQPSYYLPKDTVREFVHFARIKNQWTHVIHHKQSLYVTALLHHDDTVHYGVAPTAEQSAFLAYKRHPEPGIHGKPHWLFISPIRINDDAHWPKDVLDFHGPMHQFSDHGRGFSHHIILHKLHDGFQAAAIALPFNEQVSAYITHANGKTPHEAIHNALSQLAIEYVRAATERSKEPNFHPHLTIWLKHWINQLPTISMSELSKLNA